MFAGKSFRRLTTAVLAAFVVASLCFPAAAVPDAPAVSARAAIAVEASTGAVLFEKNADEKLAMASTTKIMTALLAVERGALNETLVIPRTYPEAEGSSIYLRPGERLTLRELLLGLMLHSGNDAAVAIAEHIAGSTEDFVALMNEKARELGMANSSFATPNGLDDEAHYSTARDMAALTCHALRYGEFADLVSTQRAVIPDSDGANRYLKNSNRLLFEYEGAIGVKTGYTKKAGRCLVSAAQREGRTIVVVTLNAPDDWNDHTALLDYGFSRTAVRHVVSAGDVVAHLPVVSSAEGSVPVLASGSFDAVCLLEEGTVETRLLLPRFVYAPVKEGQTLGEMQVYVGTRLAGTVPLAAAEAREVLVPEPGFWERVRGFFVDLFI